MFCVISYISSSYQTSVDRKFKSKLKSKWHHKCGKYFFERTKFFSARIDGDEMILLLSIFQRFNIQHFHVQLTLEANWPINFEYFKNGTTSAFFCYSTGTLVLTCIKILCSDVCKGKDRQKTCHHLTNRWKQFMNGKVQNGTISEEANFLLHYQF